MNILEHYKHDEITSIVRNLILIRVVEESLLINTANLARSSTCDARCTVNWARGCCCWRMHSLNLMIAFIQLTVATPITLPKAAMYAEWC